MKVRRTFVWLMAAGLVVVGLALSLPEMAGRVAYAVEKGQAVAARSGLGYAQDLSTAFEDVTKAVAPSVVNISSVRKVAAAQRPAGQNPMNDPLFQRFMERFGEGQMQPRNLQPEPFVERGLGTGVIVSSDGYILTNRHVVAEADTVTVTLSDDRQFDAKVVGTDAQTDVAVVKIDATGLLPAELGDSDAARVGEWVLALGNPFGLNRTVTAGIVSAVGRANVGIADYEDFIQTDAAINPGNSGGPLVDLNGKVIGINTAIASRSGGYQGIGFAIPANMARQVMDALIEHGKLVRGWLGVYIQNLNQDLAQSFGFSGTDGVLVGDVPAGSPAAESGIQAGDIIVEFNGHPVADMNKLRNTVATTAPGTEAEMRIFRDGKYQNVKVKIGELSDQDNAFGSSGGISSDTAQELGLQVEPLTPEVADQLGLSGDATGVVVTQVEPASLAERSGLRRGDVIVGIGGQHVTNMSDFRSAIAHQDLSKGVRMRVNTQGALRYVFVKK